MAKAKLTFKDVPATDKLQTVRTVLTAVAEQPALQPTNPPLSDLQLLLEQAAAANLALMVARNEARRMTLVRDQLLETLCDQMMSLTAFIQSASGGQAAVILSAGLRVAEPATRLGRLPAPENIRALLARIEGQIGLRWKPVKGRRIYQVEYCEFTEGTADWISADPCTKAKLVLKGLKSGVRYQFRVFAIGTAGRSAPSNIIILRAP